MSRSILKEQLLIRLQEKDALRTIFHEPLWSRLTLFYGHNVIVKGEVRIETWNI